MPTFLEYIVDTMPEGVPDTGLMLCFSGCGSTVQCKWGAEIEGSCHAGGSSFTQKQTAAPWGLPTAEARSGTRRGRAQGSSFMWSVGEKASESGFASQWVFTLQQRGGRTFYWSSWSCEHGGLLAAHESPWRSLLGPCWLGWFTGVP